MKVGYLQEQEMKLILMEVGIQKSLRIQKYRQEQILPLKKWWVDSNGEIKIRGFEADKSILDTMYYIEFPEGIPKYKGPVGYQGGPFLGVLNQE